MPARKRTAAPSLQGILDEMHSHSVILEDMRSQNRATIEAVAAFRGSIEERIDRLDRESRSRDSLLELAIRDLRATVQQNSADIRKNGADIEGLAGKVEALARIEERVTALERRFD